jgi:Phosphoribosyl transferase domain
MCAERCRVATLDLRSKKRRAGLSRTGIKDPIASALCTKCQGAAQTFPSGDVAKLLVAVPHAPSEYSATHSVCPSCLELHQRSDRHAERCELSLAGIALQSAGWATPLSEFLRRDLRARRPKWIALAATLLSALVDPFAGAGGAVLVPIPVSGRADGVDGLLGAVTLIGERNGTPVIRAVVRQKCRSTRLSGAQVRRRIVQEEYELDASTVESIQRNNVILVDDTVTTGATMAGIARLLRGAGAGSIVPVSLDRTVSPRLQQRLKEGSQCTCAHIAGQAGK